VTPGEALVVSGGGRFSDPWHPFAETSSALAAVLRDHGFTTTLSEDADEGLARLGATPLPSLLVLNIGWYGPDRFTDAAAEGLTAGLSRGLPTLLVHSTLTAFPDWPLWGEIVGGGWTYGTTYHPDYAPAEALAAPEHPLTAGLGRLAISDERYTGMWLDDRSSVFLEHEEGGRRHPLAWTRTWGASPVVADALGHDAGSYRALGRQVLLDRELSWLQNQEEPRSSR
jgi:uncharacterized protein